MGGLVGALGLVPWGTLIDKAPAIADGATKLFRAVRRTRADIVHIADDDATTLDPARLPDTIRALEASLLALNTQLADATLLIEELATANRRTLAAMERQRRWLIALSVGCTLAVLVALTALLR